MVVTGEAGASGGPPRVRVVGPGRAGGALMRVLGDLGWRVLEPRERGDDLSSAARDVDVVVLATPDAAIAEVAAAIEPVADTLVVHLAGAVGLDVLTPHPRRGALHPLVSIPDVERGAARLHDGAWFAVAASDALGLADLRRIVDAVGGHAVEVADADRAAYHAAAAVASNHLVALMGQVERIAAPTGVPLEAYLQLATRTLEGLVSSSPARALTGPVRRGDWATVAGHLEALAPEERLGYAALAELAARLVPDGAEPPAWLAAARRGEAALAAEPGPEGEP